MAIRHDRKKLSNLWTGPHQIVNQISEWTYQVKDLTSGRVKDVHVDHLKFYKDNKLNLTPSLREQMAFADVGYEIQRFLDIRKLHGDEWELKVRWKGFEAADDTWEPIDTLIQDVPDLVQQFLATRKQDRLVQQLRRKLKLT